MSESRMAWVVPGRDIGLYIHVPFCLSRCGYCAFHSTLYEGGDVAGYLGRMHDACGMWAGLAPVSVYIGGGTPTALSVAELKRLLDMVRMQMVWSHVEEFTVEANPATVSEEKVALLCEAGVTRVSLGAQSTEARALHLAGRRHGVDAVGEAVDLLRRGGIGRIGLDLIAGLPGTVPERWDATLAEVAAWGVEHLSVYALTIEPGTRFAQMVASNELSVPDETATVAMLTQTEATLASLGFQQYEISNFSRPGGACRHNVHVWRGGDYLGLGPSASSRIGRWRWTEAASAANGWETVEIEQLDARTDAAERLIFAFRLNEDVDLPGFCHAFGCGDELQQAWEAELDVLQTEGVVVRGGRGWRLTRRGRRLADSVAARLFERV